MSESVGQINQLWRIAPAGNGRGFVLRVAAERRMVMRPGKAIPHGFTSFARRRFDAKAFRVGFPLENATPGPRESIKDARAF